MCWNWVQRWRTGLARGAAGRVAALVPAVRSRRCSACCALPGARLQKLITLLHYVRESRASVVLPPNCQALQAQHNNLPQVRGR